MFSVFKLFQESDPQSCRDFTTTIADQNFIIPREHIRSYEDIRGDNILTPQLIALYPSLKGYTTETMNIIDSPSCDSELSFSLHEKECYERSALDEKAYEIEHEALLDTKRREGDFIIYKTKHQQELVICNKASSPSLVFLITSPGEESAVCHTRFPFNQNIDIELSFPRKQLKNWVAIYEDIVLLVNRFAKPIL